LRGELNPNRKTQIKLAFDTMDRSSSQQVPFEEIQRYFNVETHPKFMTGEMNATECL